MKKEFKKLISYILSFSAIFSSFVVSGDEVTSNQRPNVILILSDDHSYPHAGCYGDSNILTNNITPNLDRLANEGMCFEQAYTTAPQCAPSRISMFTGRHPVELGVTRFTQPPKVDVPFFTDILRQHGYWVGVDGRHQHLNGQGFELDHILEVLKEEGMRNIAHRFDHFVEHAPTKGENLNRIHDWFGSILEEVPEDKPFFLYFGFNQPHRRFDDSHEGIDPESLILPPDWPDLPEVRLDYARFLASVRDLDRGIGSILQVIDEKGLKDNTIIIFMGDNGESLLRGKGTVNSRGIHVPLIIRWPGKINKDSSSKIMISGKDLAPTILEAAGIKPPEEMTGISFFGELVGNVHFKGREYVFSERGWHWGPIERADGLDLSRSIISDRFHFIYNALPNQTYEPVDMNREEAWTAIVEAQKNKSLPLQFQQLYFPTKRPVFELYDLHTDPFELENLAGNSDYEQIETAFRMELDKWMVRNHDFLPLPSHALIP